MTRDTQADPLFLAWLAGFVDGEGTITIRSHQRRAAQKRATFHPIVIVANCERQPLGDIVAELQFGAVYNVSGQSLKANHRTRFQYQAHGQDAIDLVGLIRPYLRIKDRQADLLLQFTVTRHGTNSIADSLWEQRAQLQAAIAELNARIK